MRTDIVIHSATKDLELITENKGIDYPFSWVENPSSLVRYIYGELTIPYSLTKTTINKGLSCKIPYTPRYKEFYVRVRRDYGEGHFEYLQNPVDGSTWFLVKRGMDNAFASELIEVSPTFEYTFMLEGGNMLVYSNGISDFMVGNANNQNKNMMLMCVPTNNYRYPLSGVGLIKWVNGTTINSDMVDVLRNEFEADGTPVISAEYDFNTNQLFLDLNTANV